MREASSTTASHRRVVVSRRGGPEVLQVIQEALPEPAAGQVRLRVLAAGVSAYDAMLRQHRFPGAAKPPYTPGEDVVGLVDELGEGVTDLEPGQRVATFTWGDSGGYAEYLCRPAEQLVPVPEGLDDATAVCLVVNYLTAYVAMFVAGKAQRGERALIHGAAGGVGSALLDLGRRAGLEMYGTASPADHETVTSFGAKPIDYRNEDFVARVHALTGDGVDLVFDPIGGGKHLRRGYRALRSGGRLVWFGMAATKRRGLWVLPGTLLAQVMLALRKGDRSAPMMPDLRTFSDADGGGYRAMLTELLTAAAAGELTPAIAARFPLTEAVRAHDLLARGGYQGKIVLVAEPA